MIKKIINKTSCLPEKMVIISSYKTYILTCESHAKFGISILLVNFLIVYK